eukprot:14267945-Alexandrium_andersonii.AAC.1
MQGREPGGSRGPVVWGGRFRRQRDDPPSRDQGQARGLGLPQGAPRAQRVGTPGRHARGP